MNKTNGFLYFLIGLIIIGALGTTIFLNYRKGNNTKKETKIVETIKRKLSYSNSKYSFNIDQEDKNFYVTIYLNTNCSKETNCVNSKINEYKVADEKQINDLYNLFNELFKNAKENKLSLTENDLNIDQATIIESLLVEEEENTEPLEYEIGKPSDKGGNKKAGYTYKEENGKHIYTISLGEQTSTAYSVSIQKVLINENEANITIEEKTPGPNEVAAQVISYPCVTITFNKKPSKVTIANTNGKIYNIIEEQQEEPKEEPKKEEPKEEPKEQETPKETPKSDINYKILGPGNDQRFPTQGYTVSTVNGKTIVTIAMGKKNTGGYSIKVDKVDIVNNEATITIEEIKPNPKDMVTQAITYPINKVEFSKKPNKIAVFDKTTFKSYKEIKNGR